MLFSTCCILALLKSCSDAVFSNDSIMAAQYQAACSVPDIQQRQDKLAAVAETAAALGDMATVKMALHDLANDHRYDAVVERCAIQLGNAGHPFQAREIASMVQDRAKRKQALFKVTGR